MHTKPHPPKHLRAALLSRALRGLLLSASPGLLLTAGVAMSGCAAESLPDDQETLTLRDYLGLAPERLGQLSDPQRARLLLQLQEAWTSVVAEPPEHIVLPEQLRAASPPKNLQWPLRFVQTLDQSRASRALAPLPVALLEAVDSEADISPVAVLPEDLGLTLTPSPTLTPPSDAETAAAKRLHFDDAWPTIEDAALSGRTQRDAAESLSALWVRLLAHLSITDAKVQVVPAPRAPLLVWYVHAHRALMVNPALLYLLSNTQTPQQHPKPTLVTRESALDLAFINSCVSDQRSRCASCRDATVAEDIVELCVPLYPVIGESPSQTALAECARFLDPGDDVYRVGDLVKLQCYNDYASIHAACISDTLWDRCGLSRVPVSGLDLLWMLNPMLTDERCQYALQTCYERETRPDPPPPTNPPLDDGTPPPTPTDPYLPETVDSSSGDCSGFADSCTTSCQVVSACSEDTDNGSPETGEGACESTDDGSGSGSSGDSDLCEGDSTTSSDSSSSLCDSDSSDEEDDEEEEAESAALPVRPMRGNFGRDGLLLLSLLWLGFAWYRDVYPRHPRDRSAPPPT